MGHTVAYGCSFSKDANAVCYAYITHRSFLNFSLPPHLHVLMLFTVLLGKLYNKAFFVRVFHTYVDAIYLHGLDEIE